MFRNEMCIVELAEADDLVSQLVDPASVFATDRRNYSQSYAFAVVEWNHELIGSLDMPESGIRWVTSKLVSFRCR